MAQAHDVSLPTLFQRALNAASKASTLATIEDETQELIESALKDLRLLSSRLDALALFSENETLEDVATKDLVYMLVPFVIADVEGRARALEVDERKERLVKAAAQLRRFEKLLEDYGIVPAEEKALFKRGATNDPRTRREVKINQFKKEKEIRSKVAEVRARRKQAPSSDSPTDFDLIASLLPTSSPNDDEPQDDEDNVRALTLLLLRLFWTQAQNTAETMSQEMELLRSAPPPQPQAPRDERKEKEDATWRLDDVRRGGPDGKGPLLDSKGKVVRPFTIVSSDRARLQAEVFRPDHRLPTMTIEEYLEEEKRRGNIISGGGPQSANKLTKKEQLALDAEMDGTREGQEKEEEKRQEDERWAQFTDANPKGMGNTLNRG